MKQLPAAFPKAKSLCLCRIADKLIANSGILVPIAIITAPITNSEIPIYLDIDIALGSVPEKEKDGIDLVTLNVEGRLMLAISKSPGKLPPKLHDGKLLDTLNKIYHNNYNIMV